MNLFEDTNIQIKKSVISIFKKQWLDKINDLETNPLLRTYIHIKSEFKLEPYLHLVKNVKYRNAIAKFRTSSHTLEIERGRHTRPKTPINNRKCWYCDSVETEMHFLTECKYYEAERALLYTDISQLFPYFSQINNSCKLKFMLCFHDEKLLTLVGKFIYTCFEKRKLLAHDVHILS